MITGPIVRRRWAPDEMAEAKQLYESGTSLEEMASRLKRGQTAILRKASKAKWQRPISNQERIPRPFWYEENPIPSYGASSRGGFKGVRFFFP